MDTPFTHKMLSGHIAVTVIIIIVMVLDRCNVVDNKGSETKTLHKQFDCQ